MHADCRRQNRAAAGRILVSLRVHDYRLPRPLHHRSQGASGLSRYADRCAQGSRAASLRRQDQISDDQIRESLEGAQLKLQRERGTDVTIFSPRASAMAHHIGTARTSADWSRQCNDLINPRLYSLSQQFVGVCQLPQSPGGIAAERDRRARAVRERIRLHRLQLNPDPSGWSLDLAAANREVLVSRLYEKMVELDVPPWCM